MYIYIYIYIEGLLLPRLAGHRADALRADGAELLLLLSVVSLLLVLTIYKYIYIYIYIYVFVYTYIYIYMCIHYVLIYRSPPARARPSLRRSPPAWTRVDMIDIIGSSGMWC